MLKRWWDKFMCPNGIRRTFNPKKWEHGTSVLVFGELVAFGAAVAAIPGWTHGQWFLYAAPIIAAGALAWYALDKSSLGEMPLTGTSARRIAAVIALKNAEDKIGPVFKWDTISGDGTQVMSDLSKLKPEIKDKVAPSLVASALQEATPGVSHEEAAQFFALLSEADKQQFVDAIMQQHTNIPFKNAATAEGSEALQD